MGCEVTIDDICSSVCSGGTPQKSNSEYYENGNIPWLNTKEISFNRIRKTKQFITEAGLRQSSAKWVRANSVVVAMYGATAGKVAITKIPLTTNQACCNLEVDKEVADYRYIYYWFQNQYSRVLNLANGGAQQNLNAKTIKAMEIKLPNLALQQRIANCLSAIDDEIELNIELNGYLEKLVSLEFSRRFKASTPTIELGKVLSISTESIKPQEHAGEIWEHYSIPAYDENRQPLFELSDGIKSNKYAIDANCILISKLNPATKRIWMPSCTSEHSVCSTEFIVYKPKNPKYKSFYYAAIDSQVFTDFLIAHVTGSTGSRQRTQPKATLTYTMPNPGHDAIEGFCAFADPIYKQIQSNRLESQWLVSLRDALLPKLMSGEIDVSKIDLTQLNSHLEKRKAAASVLSLIFPIALPGLWSPMQ